MTGPARTARRVLHAMRVAITLTSWPAWLQALLFIMVTSAALSWALLDMEVHIEPTPPTACLPPMRCPP
jgi:hypothetical protein